MEAEEASVEVSVNVTASFMKAGVDASMEASREGTTLVLSSNFSTASVEVVEAPPSDEVEASMGVTVYLFTNTRGMIRAARLSGIHRKLPRWKSS